MKKMKVLMLFAVLIFMSVSGACSQVDADDLLVAGDQAPEFAPDAKWFGGGKSALADYKGKKAVLLYFLKPACGSCDKFSPHLYRLMLQNKDDLQVIGVSEYPQSDIEEYIKNRLGNYAVVSDPDRSYINRYLGKVDLYPFVALIDKEGKLAWIGRGKFHAQVTHALKRVLGKEKPEEVTTEIKNRYAILVSAEKGKTAIEQEKRVKEWEESLQKNGYSDIISVVCGSEDSADAGQSVVDEINTALSKIAEKATADDLVMFYFSGDGTVVAGNKDISLKIQQCSLEMSKVKDCLLGAEKKNRVFIVIDANHEGTKLKEWEDIAGDLGKANPKVGLMLSAARWDFSVLNDDKSGTLFADMFFKAIGNCGKDKPVNEFWLCLRDRMLQKLRASGKLQTPFICNPGGYSLCGNVKK